MGSRAQGLKASARYKSVALPLSVSATSCAKMVKKHVKGKSGFRKRTKGAKKLHLVQVKKVIQVEKIKTERALKKINLPTSKKVKKTHKGMQVDDASKKVVKQKKLKTKKPKQQKVKAMETDAPVAAAATALPAKQAQPSAVSATTSPKLAATNGAPKAKPDAANASMKPETPKSRKEQRKDRSKALKIGRIAGHKERQGASMIGLENVKPVKK